MNARMRSTTFHWTAFAVVGTFAFVLIVLISIGVLGSVLWWTAAAMILLAASQLTSIRAIRRENRQGRNAVAARGDGAAHP